MDEKLVLRETGKSKNSPLSLVPEIRDVKELLDFAEKEVGFRPSRGDIMAYKADGNFKLYITKSGYSKLADLCKISTKIEVLNMINKPNMKAVSVKCTAVKDDGTFHEELGFADSSEPGKNWQNISQLLGMAITRARNRAINVASNVAAGTFDEMPEEKRNRMQDINEQLKKCPKCKKVGWSQDQKRCIECNVTYEQIIEEAKK